MPHVLAVLDRDPNLSAFSGEPFSTRSRLYWLSTTKAGVAVGFVAALGRTDVIC